MNFALERKPLIRISVAPIPDSIDEFCAPHAIALIMHRMIGMKLKRNVPFVLHAVCQCNQRTRTGKTLTYKNFAVRQVFSPVTSLPKVWEKRNNRERADVERKRLKLTSDHDCHVIG